MNTFLTTESRPEGVYLYDEDEEVGIIRYKDGHWKVAIFNREAPNQFRSLEAAQYFALSLYIETRWAAEEAGFLRPKGTMQ
jgi:hypothetical protein